MDQLSWLTFRWLALIELLYKSFSPCERKINNEQCEYSINKMKREHLFLREEDLIIVT